MVEFSLVQFTDDYWDLWNEYVTGNPTAQIYHLWEWGEVLSKTYDHKRYYLALKRGQNIVGILPLILIRSSFFGDKLLSLPFCEYGGPLLNLSDPSTVKHALMILLKTTIRLTRKLKVGYMEIRHPSDFLSSHISSSGLLKASERYLTFRVDLTKNESELWRNVKRDAKRRVRKALEAGIRVKEIDADRINEFYKLYLGTQKGHGTPPHSYEFFVNTFNMFKPKGLLRVLLAEYEGNLVAGDMIFCFNRQIKLWSSVSDAKYRNLGPTHLLHWQIMKWGRERNYKVFDLGRTRLGASGIYLFKSRWGGNEMNLRDYLFTTRNVEIPDPLQSKYIYLSKMWSLMPQPLASRLGPDIVSKIGL